MLHIFLFEGTFRQVRIMLVQVAQADQLSSRINPIELF